MRELGRKDGGREAETCGISTASHGIPCALTKSFRENFRVNSDEISRVPRIFPRWDFSGSHGISWDAAGCHLGSRGMSLVIDLAKNPLSSSNGKHIDVRYHFLRELVGKRDLSVKYLRTDDQHADIVTKAILRESFEKHRDFLLGILSFTSKNVSGSCKYVRGLLVDPAPGRVFDIACLNEQK